MRLRLMLAVLAMSLVSAVPLARAQSELDRARDDVAAVTERLEGYLDDIAQTQQRGDELAARYWQVESNMQRLELDIATGEVVSADLAAERVGLVEEVRLIALDRYVSRREVYNVSDLASEADRAAAEALARVLVGSDHSAIDELAASDDAIQRQLATLEAKREAQRQTLADVEATQAALLDELDQLVELRDSLARELASLDEALGVLEAAEAQRQQAAAERERLAQERERAMAAAAAARAQVRAVVPTPSPAPAAPTAVEPTRVPNPQPSQPTPAANAPSATSVPNPQPSQPFPTTTAAAPVAAQPTSVANPQPSQPFPTPIAAAPVAAQPTSVANPQPTTPVGGGAMLCPLAGPFTHTDDFNSPRAVGGIHRANDLIAASGTPVIAVVAGNVEHKNSSVGGLSAHLRADNGDYYFFTHLSGYENQGAGHVSAGTVIGYVGMTGNAPIPHLHFEIHLGGRGNYTNPYGPVRNACF